MSEREEQAPAEQQPLLRVISPGTTPEEVAAIVAVLASLGGGEAPAPKPVSEWSSLARRVRPALQAGPGAWRGSALPR